MMALRCQKTPRQFDNTFWDLKNVSRVSILIGFAV
jgi:hypothetical protein